MKLGFNELKGIQKDEGLQHQGQHDHHIGREQVMEQDDQGEGKGRREKVDEWEEIVGGAKKGRKEENEKERQTKEGEIGRFRIVLFVMGEKEEKGEKIEVDEAYHEKEKRIVGRMHFVAYAERHPS